MSLSFSSWNIYHLTTQHRVVKFRISQTYENLMSVLKFHFRPIPLYGGQRPTFDFSRFGALNPSWPGFLPSSPWKLTDVTSAAGTATSSHLAAYNLYLQEHIKRLQEASFPKLFDSTSAVQAQRLPVATSGETQREEDIRKSHVSLVSPTNSKDVKSPSLTSSFSESYGSQYNLGRKLFPCPQCRYTTDRRNNLKRHMLTMHQTCSKLLECCGILFNTKASLREHSMIFHYHGYTCFYCGRRFCRKALLKRHLSVHNGQKDFVCTVCDYATSHKSNLERHRKVHLRQEDASDEASNDNGLERASSPNEIEKGEEECEKSEDIDVSVCSESEDEEINVHTD